MAYQRDHPDQKTPPRDRDYPTLSHLPIASEFSRSNSDYVESPISPLYDSTTPLYQNNNASSVDSREYFVHGNKTGRQPPARQYSEEIPLTKNAQPISGGKEEASIGIESIEDEEVKRKRRRAKEKESKPFFSWETTWIVYILSLIQATVFIAELVKNALYTSIPIQIKPQVNPMIGPSYYVLINMGGRYVPCMKNISSLGLPPNLSWPCPWSTTNNASDPSMQCTIEQLCGFPPTGNPPIQWFRFIVPIFLHAGFIHIGFNLLLQLTLGRDMEKKIGHVRFLLVYLASGIFGFVLGGNYAADGIVSMGASGSLFGIIAINLLDLLYNWREKRSPWKDLIFIVIDIAISFVLGLLPGLDNFSHIGGFLMGLVTGVCILHSPNQLRETLTSSIAPPAQAKRSRRRRPTFKSFAKSPLDFFKDRKALWWLWWLVRVVALLAVLVCFIILLNNFYIYSNTCSWCKYLSCLNVNNWCDVGNLNSEIQYPSSPSKNARDLFSNFAGQTGIDF